MPVQALYRIRAQQSRGTTGDHRLERANPLGGLMGQPVKKSEGTMPDPHTAGRVMGMRVWDACITGQATPRATGEPCALSADSV